MNLKNQLDTYGNLALITGASSGVGKGFAKILLEAGINCILVSENVEELNATKAELSNLGPNEIITITCDFRNETELTALLNNPLIQSCKIIINCAGIGLMGYFIQHPYKNYEMMLAINVTATLILTHYFCQKFYNEKTKGAIINIGSANAELNYPIPFSAVYSAEKSLIKYMTEAISYEMKPFGIDILAVSCGPVATAFQKKAGTNTLSWCETPEHVAIKAFAALGKRDHVITNTKAKWLIRLFHWLPLSRKFRLKIVSWFFAKVLAKKSQVHLD